MTTTLKLYHVTTRENALLILARGFRDATGSYGIHDAETGAPVVLTGVWLADQPLTVNEGVSGDTVLEVTLDVPADRLTNEVVEEGKGYREWIVPAALINQHGSVRLMEADINEAFVQQSLAMRRAWLDADVQEGRLTRGQADVSLRDYEEQMRRWEPPDTL